MVHLNLEYRSKFGRFYCEGGGGGEESLKFRNTSEGITKNLQNF